MYSPIRVSLLYAESKLISITFYERGAELRFVPIRCDWQRVAAIRSRWGASGGVRGRSGAKAKKANGFLRKPNNPWLYVNVSLTNDNVCMNPQNVSRKRKNVCIYSLYACRFGGNADGIIIGGHYEADSKH